jgi:LPPG:FO 2-phospho-L-lactate transferase
MALKRIVALAGGVGGAKLALGLARALPPGQLTVIVNTGDDFSRYGLAISPDLDTVMYTLAGVANPETGWGLAGDTTQMLDMLRQYGEQPWFGLGDRDLATHLLRTQWLAEGQSLTEVTRRLGKGLRVNQTILPMSDDPVRTLVDTVEYGELAFQEYFVKYRWQPVVRRITYVEAEAARPSEGALKAITEADAVVICPSNPLLSVAPILAVPGMREALQKKPVIAVTPIVSGKALKGPAAKLMNELGWTVSPPSVAAYYGDLLAGFVLDKRDAGLYAQTDFGCQMWVADSVMVTEEDKVRLARQVLAWAEEVSG